MNRCIALLTCPICNGALSDTGSALRCDRRHAFDRARAGYWDLLPTGHGRAAITGDVRDMVEARRRFLARGHFNAVGEAVCNAALASSPRVVLDAGCGEGWYLGRVMHAHATPQDACFIGTDISRDALRLAARAHRDAVFLVGDVGHRLCLADASVDVLLNIFAPRNEGEFARVLAPGGLLVVAVPADDHLHELREVIPMLDVQPAKLERTIARFAGAFEVVSHEEVRLATSLGADDVRDAVMMGPSYWHLDAAATQLQQSLVATVAVHVVCMRLC